MKNNALIKLGGEREGSTSNTSRVIRNSPQSEAVDAPQPVTFKIINNKQ